MAWEGVCAPDQNSLVVSVQEQALPGSGAGRSPRVYSPVFVFVPFSQAGPAFQSVMLYGEPWQGAGLAEAPV